MDLSGGGEGAKNKLIATLYFYVTWILCGEGAKNQQTDSNVIVLSNVDFSGDGKGAKNKQTDGNVNSLPNVDFSGG